MKNRIKILIFSFLLLFGLVATAWADNAQETVFEISHEGEAISEIVFPQNEKRTINVTANKWSDAYEFQWQILVSIEEELWVDIQDATTSSLEVSHALIEEVMDEARGAYIRCEVAVGEDLEYTNAVCVTSTYVAPISDYESESKEVVESDPSEESSPKLLAFMVKPRAAAEKVSITINYLDAQKGEPIYSPYVAEIEYGTNFKETEIISPTFLGYEPKWNQSNPSIAIPAEGEVYTPDDASELVLSYTSLTENIVINVYYKPIEVSYSIKYFFQNINNDLYTEDATLYRLGYAYTGTIMGDNDLAVLDKDKDKIVGFTKLYHYPESIAADGSTAFECYYDRNYYLLKFDPNEGYGVDPVYGRYDAAFLVNKPVKPGFEFVGWDLISETVKTNTGATVTYDKDHCPAGYGVEFEDGVADVVPAKIPAKSQSYRAIWEEVETTYTVVYWTQNPNDNGYSYVGSEVREAYSNSKAQGACPIEEHTHVNDCLTCGDPGHAHTDSCYDCGKEEHTHVEACYPDDEIMICGKQGHKHDNSCIGCGKEEHTHVIACFTDHPVSETAGVGSIKQLTDNFTDSVDNDATSHPQNGYVYRTNRWGNKMDNYFYWGDKWYHLDEGNNYEGITTGAFGDYQYLWSGTYYRVAKANVRLCSKAEHTHDSGCIVCDYTGHIHTDACYFDLRHYEYETSILTDDKGDPIIVMGDGSTVVNVRYTRKNYTFRFYISRSRTVNGEKNYQVCGYTTPFADVVENNFVSMIANTSWDETGVKDPPSLNANGIAAGYEIKETDPIDGYTYQYIELTSRYGEYIKDKFPVDMFDPVTNLNTQVYGDTAYFSAWNVEFHTYYSWHNSNKTLKGRYSNVDYTMLYNYCQTCDESDCTNDEHTQYDDYPIIHFLGFWENAVDVGDNDWNAPHKFNYNVYVPVIDGETLPNGTITREKNGITYKQIDTCVIYDNNAGGTNINIDTNGDWLKEHTPPAVEGYKFVARDGQYKNTWDTENSLRLYDVNFFYERNKYSLAFMNLDQIESQHDNVAYESDLKDYAHKPSYPENLEKNAYTFEGWYTSEKCVQGSEFVLDGKKMPASDLILYADWVPIKHTVRFFQTYEDMTAYEENGDTTGLLHTFERDHGQVVGTVDNPEDRTQYDYDFSGWFYIDGGIKTAFTPLDMPVKKSINVFADWSSHTAQPYVIHYVLKNKENTQGVIDLLTAEAAGNLQQNVRYEITYNGEERGYVYLEEDSGWHRCIADSTSGFAYQGSTRTFVAKAGDPYNQLYATGTTNYNLGYFPLVANHSITMQYESNQLVASANAYSFQYVSAQNLKYTVQYIDKTTGKELLDPIICDSNGKAVVTERFAVIADYVPDAFYKRLVLAVEEKDGEYVSSSENVITFYYTPNDTVAYYAVHYMMQKPGAGTANKAIDGTGDYEESDFHTEGVGNIGAHIQIKPSTFTGFNHINEDGAVEVIDGNPTTKDIVDNGDDDYCEITIDESGTEIYLFYTRKTYNYKIYHLKYRTNVSDVLNGTDLSGLLKVETTDKDSNPLQGQYGTVVSATTQLKPEGAIFNRLVCVSKPLTQSITIRADEDHEHVNNIYFFYAPVQYTVEYRIPGGVGGTVSKTIEVVDEGTFEGSTATQDPGYDFNGWFLDEDCTIPAVDDDDDDKTFTPDFDQLQPMPTVNYFYAKFTPKYGKLTITRQTPVVTDEGNGDQVYVYKITNKSNASHVFYVQLKAGESVVIEGLLQTDYIVEQQPGWSWRYEGEMDKAITQEVTIPAGDAGATVTFKDDPTDSQWLNANSDVLVNKKSKGATP